MTFAHRPSRLTTSIMSGVSGSSNVTPHSSRTTQATFANTPISPTLISTSGLRLTRLRPTSFAPVGETSLTTTGRDDRKLCAEAARTTSSRIVRRRPAGPSTLLPKLGILGLPLDSPLMPRQPLIHRAAVKEPSPKKVKSRLTQKAGLGPSGKSEREPTADDRCRQHQGDGQVAQTPAECLVEHRSLPKDPNRSCDHNRKRESCRGEMLALQKLNRRARFSSHGRLCVNQWPQRIGRTLRGELRPSGEIKRRSG